MTSASEVATEFARLHAPMVSFTDSVLDEGEHEWRDVDPASFEAITSQETLCMTCAGYPQWPCLQAALLMQAGYTFEGNPSGG